MDWDDLDMDWYDEDIIWCYARARRETRRATFLVKRKPLR